uniref:Transposase n=1 Tax=Acrobeloides nanus TaxID=290746 RepID=A0A914CNJ9_9BILA
MSHSVIAIMMWSGALIESSASPALARDSAKVRRHSISYAFCGIFKNNLRTKVFPWARRTYGQWQRHLIFQQDASHKAEETQNLIRDNVPEFIEVDISPQRNNGEWPLNSPDLNILDYSLWSILEAEACSKPHQSVEALKKSLVKAWNAIPQEVIDRAVDDFPKRLKKCIDARWPFRK